MIVLTFRHSINQSDKSNSHSINQSDLICRYREQEDAKIQIINTNVLHLFVSHRKHIPNAGVPLCNKIFACHPDNRGAHSGIFGRWQTTGVAQLTTGWVTVKMYYANDLTKPHHWCKVCHLWVTSHFNCRSRFQNWQLKFLLCNLHEKLQFEVYWLCGIFAGENYSELGPIYWNSDMHWFITRNSDQYIETQTCTGSLIGTRANILKLGHALVQTNDVILLTGRLIWRNMPFSTVNFWWHCKSYADVVPK